MRRRPDGRAEDGAVQLEAQLVKQVSVAKTQSAVHRNSGINRFAHAEEKRCIYPTSPQLDQGLTEVQYISKKKRLPLLSLKVRSQKDWMVFGVNATLQHFTGFV